MAVIEFLKAYDAPINGFYHPGIFFKVEIRRFPFTFEFLRRDRDGGITICRAHIEDELCNGLHVRPLSGTQVEAHVKKRFNCFGLCVHNVHTILTIPTVVE